MPVPLVPRQWPGLSEWCRKLAEALDVVASGTSRTVGSVTLTANATSTTVTDARVTPSSHISLTPTTANAAAEVGAGGMYVSARTGGASFTITHANDASVDRSFTYEVRNP